MNIPYIVLWKWTSPGYRSSFSAENVNSAAWMLHRHGIPREKIVCVTDDPSGIYGCAVHPMWSDHSKLRNISGPQLPSCYRRLKLFCPDVTRAMGIPEGHRVCSVDLDMVILQDFPALFNLKVHDDRDFVGWRVPGVRHRIVYNGSIWMFPAGRMSWIWEEFDPDKSPLAASSAGYMGSDQGYLSHRLVHLERSGGWNASEHGVLSYARDVQRARVLPKHTRVVFFPGKNKPWLDHVKKQSNWILRYVPRVADLEKMATPTEELEVA